MISIVDKISLLLLLLPMTSEGFAAQWQSSKSKSSIPVVSYPSETMNEDLSTRTSSTIRTSDTASSASGVKPASDEFNTSTFPFHMIVGNQELKKAAVIAAANPNVSGLLIGGRHGTCKSVAARAVHNLLPNSIERIQSSRYNIDPLGEDGIDSLLLEKLKSNKEKLESMKTEEINLPFVQVPLNVMEDSLCGSIDIEKSIESGETVFAPGLLAKAHRGVLYIDDIHLLDESILNILFDVISDGWVKVEKEGISVKYPCKPLVIATWNPDEGEMTEHFTDRMALSMFTDNIPLSVMDRVEATNNVIGLSGDAESRERDEFQLKEAFARHEDEKLKCSIAAARSLVKEVKISQEQILYLCNEATRAGCQGQRAEIYATHTAKTCAALEGRMFVNAEDLKSAVEFVIFPRSKYYITYGDVDKESEENCISDDEKNEMQENTTLESLPPHDKYEYNWPEETHDDKPMEKDEFEEDASKMEQKDNEEISDNEEVDDEVGRLEIPEEFMFSPNLVPIDPQLLSMVNRSKKGKGRKGSKVFNFERGRFVKAVFPPPTRRGRIAVGATLRAAAPYQKLRSSRAKTKNSRMKAVYVEKEDFRVKKMSKKSGSLIIFVVDSSGSMALNRMDSAKGAAITLLSEAYKARDKIALIEFHQKSANVLVPPTKSTSLTKKRLESMPCGGGSPLADALLSAVKMALNELKVKKDVGSCVIVLITDGRVNVPLCISRGEKFDAEHLPSIDGRPTKEYLQDEVLHCAQILPKLGLDLVVIDSEDKFVGTGIARLISTKAQGTYIHIDPRDVRADNIANIVSSINK